MIARSDHVLNSARLPLNTRTWLMASIVLALVELVGDNRSLRLSISRQTTQLAINLHLWPLDSLPTTCQDGFDALRSQHNERELVEALECQRIDALVDAQDSGGSILDHLRSARSTSTPTKRLMLNWKLRGRIPVVDQRESAAELTTARLLKGTTLRKMTSHVVMCLFPWHLDESTPQHQGCRRRRSYILLPPPQEPLQHCDIPC